jgi:K+-transporting ATPase A subunit
VSNVATCVIALTAGLMIFPALTLGPIVEGLS